MRRSAVSLKFGDSTWSEHFVLEICKLLEQHQNNGGAFSKSLRSLAAIESPALFCVDDGVKFAKRSALLFRSHLSAQKQALRLRQLKDGKFAYWVYKTDRDCGRHQRFDGVALEEDHPFWKTHFPPNCWGCCCSVFGTNSKAGIVRVGGVPGKELPSGWDDPDGQTGLPIDLDLGFHTNDLPYLPLCLKLISDGTCERMDFLS